MDEPQASNLSELLSTLPPVLQGAAAVGVGLGVAFWFYRRFSSRLKLDPPEPTVLAVGDPTTIADMGPIKDLIKNVATLTDQHAKTEMSVNAFVVSNTVNTEAMKSVATSLERLADICGQIMLDIREERELRAGAAMRADLIAEGKRQAIEEIAEKRRARRGTRSNPRPRGTN